MPVLKTHHAPTHNLLQELLQRHHKLHFSLIDPDKQPPARAGEIAQRCQSYGTDAILVGGTTVHDRKMVFDTIEAIQKSVDLPVILFPNSAEAITENLRYILFMMLLNSQDKRYTGGEQAKGALLVKRWGIQPISAGYVVVSTSHTPTTVEKAVPLDRISRDDLDKAVSYALYAEMTGMSCVYFDAGSGAEQPISNEMIKAIRSNISIPIIIGGGIIDAAMAQEKITAGADIIVNGTLVEDNLKKIQDIVKTIKAF